ncbi:uncharacterized protein DUF1569 [Acidovorax sp. 69]|uniref:DUF1569 domain-containing protein n=1 Tax=Acidovorax sp. 69 TaxID=2035202 RepID=UPI000C237083|nr:DUF1569 domain-containing protein [Acidovorax sp. 69]PJI97401.1 uncharacterized protein DUF1569 [Acidovorax sp. 69]
MAVTPPRGAQSVPPHPDTYVAQGPTALPANPARRSFVRWGVGLATVGGVVAGAGYFLHRPGNDRQLVFGTISEALREVERLNAASVHALVPATAWNWSQTLEHCAQSIEYSLQGFPEPKSALFQNTVGTAAFSVFAQRGRMSHSLEEPIPGAPVLDASAPDAAAALARLRKAAQDFAAYSGTLHPHFAYGALSRVQYEQAHAMHLANHLSAFDGRPQG